MTSQDTEAMKALVAKWRKQADSLRTENPDFSDGLSASRDECADDLEAALERMLASQGEAVLGNVPPLYPQPSPGESITVTYEESPPLAESVGDVEGKQ